MFTIGDFATFTLAQIHPMLDTPPADDELLIRERPRLWVAATVRTGPLDDLASACAAVVQWIEQWIEARGLVPAGGAAQLSLVWDPQHPDRNVTELQLPVTTPEGS